MGIGTFLRHYRCCLLWLLIGLWQPIHAEVLQPVRWTGEPLGDSIRLTAEVDSGWHLTVISIGDSMLGQEYASGCTLNLAPDKEGKISVRYNACDDSQCTSPEVFTYPADTHPAADTPLPAPRSASSLLRLLLLGLLGGLLAVFTPCVWPVIPMTVSFFLKRGGGRRDALLFGLSIVVIYVGLGLLVTLLFGASALNALSTSAPLNIFFFLLLVVFALSFFGLFDLSLPSSWATRMDARARSASGWASILMMAFTLVIVSFSCTGPIIGTLLVEAASQSLLAPAVGMTGFALALALPFTLFALFPHWMQRSPRSGEWMQTLKVTLAFVELAFSLKFLSVADMAYGWGILPRWLFILLWILCSLSFAVYLIVQTRKNRQTAFRGVLWGLALLSLAFAMYLLPGLRGAPVRLVSAFAPPLPVEGKAVFNDFEEGMAYARQEHKPVLLQFTGYGCVNCRKMEAYVLDNPTVREAMNAFVCITLYVDSRRDENRNGIPDGEEFSRLQQERFGSNAQPHFVQLTPDGIPDGKPHFYSTDPQEFLQWLGIIDY